MTLPCRRPPHPSADIDVQTENYLEELSDNVRVSEVDTQTDAFLDRPATPLFVPQKIGVDVETQIEEGDLFDFDLEVSPILEVITGKTLEQALMEVLEEEELANLRHHQVRRAAGRGGWRGWKRAGRVAPGQALGASGARVPAAPRPIRACGSRAHRQQQRGGKLWLGCMRQPQSRARVDGRGRGVQMRCSASLRGAPLLPAG